jgi:hypothetical protein
VAVSQDTKDKLNKTKSSISQTIDVTGTYLSQLFRPVADKASELKKDLNTHIDKSSNESNAFISSLALKQGRTVTVATWDAASNAFAGLGSALSTVGDSLGNNTRKVVEKKYGQDVTNTFLGGEAKASSNSSPEQAKDEVKEPLEVK